MISFDHTAEQRILSTFGAAKLRAGQRQLIEAALAGQNALGVLPTGHGKSLCYQAAALLLGGTSVVVSPLIALMRDQCDSLTRRGIPAARFDSTLEQEEREQVLAAVNAGELRLLFIHHKKPQRGRFQGSPQITVIQRFRCYEEKAQFSGVYRG